MTRDSNRLIRTETALIVFVAALFICAMTDAEGHESPTGWLFDPSCCSNRDCGEVPADWITEGANGITIVPTGELLSYADTRVKKSQDEHTYWCRPPGNPNPKTICVYLPAKAF